MSAHLRRHPAEIVLSLLLLLGGAVLLSYTLRSELWTALGFRPVRMCVRFYGLLNMTAGLCLLLRAPHLVYRLQWSLAAFSLLCSPFLFWVAYGQSKYHWPDVFRGSLFFQWLVPLALGMLHYGIGRWLKALNAARD
jgi:hypothetical protein